MTTEFLYNLQAVYIIVCSGTTGYFDVPTYDQLFSEANDSHLQENCPIFNRIVSVYFSEASASFASM